MTRHAECEETTPAAIPLSTPKIVKSVVISLAQFLFPSTFDSPIDSAQRILFEYRHGNARVQGSGRRQRSRHASWLGRRPTGRRIPRAGRATRKGRFEDREGFQTASTAHR